MQRLIDLGTRLFQVLITLLIGSFLVYTSLYLAPGSPVATLSGGRTLSPQARAALEERYHLNDPFLTRYWDWLWGVLHGDLGQSIQYRTSVVDLIKTGLGVSVPLLVLALVIVLIVGLPLGGWSGLAGRRTDSAISGAMSVGLAMPAFVVAPLLVYVFAVQLGWFNVVRGSGHVALTDLVLPALALSVSMIAFVGRVTRAAVLEERESDHAQFARLRGLRRGTVVRDHILRNSAIGVVTVSGLTVAALVGGLVVVEVAFNLNGLGYFLIAAVNGRDFALVQGITLVLFTFFVVLTAVLDAVYPLLDPRLARRNSAE